jgi:hypothetical protein
LLLVGKPHVEFILLSWHVTNSMDPFHLVVALGPVSVYMLLIGRINLARRSFVTTGSRDAFAVAIATSGLMMAGPMQLFMPEGAAAHLGTWIWAPLMGLYILGALLISLLMRPRLLIYNVTSEQLRPVLESVANQLDPDRNWTGGSLLLPTLGLQLVVEAAPAMRHVQLIAAGSAPQDLNSWRQLELALKEALRPVVVRPNPRGLSFVVFGVLIGAMVLLELSGQPQAVVQSWDEFLRRL